MPSEEATENFEGAEDLESSEEANRSGGSEGEVSDGDAASKSMSQSAIFLQQ